MSVIHLNPPELHTSPASSQGVSVEGSIRTVYIGGQNGVDAEGSIVSDEVGDQTAAALRNLEQVVGAAGGSLNDVVSWSIALVDGQPLGPAFGEFQSAWGERGEPPAVTVACVAGLARPEFLVEVSGVAVVAAAGETQ